ncbi:uncharacterized protein ACBT57_011011 isoform 1-T1 [Dama dama]
MEPVPPALEAQSLDRWTTGEDPRLGRRRQTPHLGMSDESFLKGRQEDLSAEQPVWSLTHIGSSTFDPGRPETVRCRLRRVSRGGASSKGMKHPRSSTAAPLRRDRRSWKWE